MPSKILGINASPVKKGNTSTFLSRIMDEAAGKGLETGTIPLRKMDIRHCTHCNFCLSRQKKGAYCAIRDDLQPVYERLEQADIIVLASPVYFMRTSGMMAGFIDRLRVFIFGNIAGGKLRNKIGISAGVSWLRHAGMETTHLTHLMAFMTLDMIPATTHDGISPLGASALSSRNGQGHFDPEVRLGATRDTAGLESAKAQLDRALELHSLIHQPG